MPDGLAGPEEPGDAEHVWAETDPALTNNADKTTNKRPIELTRRTFSEIRR